MGGRWTKAINQIIIGEFVTGWTAALMQHIINTLAGTTQASKRRKQCDSDSRHTG